MPRSRGYCRTQCIQLGALAHLLMEPGWDTLQPGGGLERCAWGKGPRESDPHRTAAEAELTAYVSLEPNRKTQEMVSGYSLPTHLAVPLGQGRTRHFSTRDQLTQGGYSFVRLGSGESHQPPHLGNGLLPPRASRKKDPGADKKQTELGTLRQLRGGQAGRQADWGRSLWSLAMQGLIAGASPD